MPGATSVDAIEVMKGLWRLPLPAGLSDGDEARVHATDPLKPDTEGDGMSDGWEISYGFDPLLDDAAGPGIDAVAKRLEAFLEGVDSVDDF